MTSQSGKPVRDLLRLALVAVLSGAAGFFVWQYLHGSDPNAEQTLRPDFEIADEQGVPQHVGQWDGKVLLLNFWATWCPPCRAEIPMLTELQADYGKDGLQVVGLAMDRVEAVRQFREEITFNYPTLVGDRAVMAVADACGDTVGALPFNVVIDRQGRIIHRHFGELDRETAESLLLPLLKPTPKGS